MMICNQKEKNHTVKGFGIVNKAEIDVFLELSCFFNDPGAGEGDDPRKPLDSMRTPKTPLDGR